MKEFAKYADMRDAGGAPDEVYMAAKASGLSEIEAIRMLRTVFGMSLQEAKETTIVASGSASSLKEHEEQIARELSNPRK